MIALKILAVLYYAFIVWLIVGVARHKLTNRPQNTTI